CRPKDVKHQAVCDRAQVDERRTYQPKICDVRPGSFETAVISRIVYHAVSSRPPIVLLNSTQPLTQELPRMLTRKMLQRAEYLVARAYIQPTSLTRKSFEVGV